MLEYCGAVISIRDSPNNNEGEVYIMFKTCNGYYSKWYHLSVMLFSLVAIAASVSISISKPVNDVLLISIIAVSAALAFNQVRILWLRKKGLAGDGIDNTSAS